MGLDFISQFVYRGAAIGTFQSGARLVRKLALPGMAGNNFSMGVLARPHPDLLPQEKEQHSCAPEVFASLLQSPFPGLRLNERSIS